MPDEKRTDHQTAARAALANAEQGFQDVDREQAVALSVQIAIGHALVHIGDILSRISEDANEARRSGG